MSNIGRNAMYDDICALVKKQITVSSAGDPVETEKSRTEVFCEVMSASYRDKEAAQARGEKAELTIRLSDRADYDGEIFVEYNSEEYQVVDTYFDDRSRELRLVVGKWQRQ